MEKEIWKPVKGYEGLYEVSNLGNVRRLWPLTNHTRKLKVFVRCAAPQDYLAVNLSKGNKLTTKSVHRLVAEAFIPNPLGLPMVNHKDENKRNPHVDNLEWCDCKYNSNYGNARKNRSVALRNNEKVSFVVGQYTLDGELVAVFPSISEASRSTGIAKITIRLCATGKPIKKKRRDGTVYDGYIPKTAGGYKWAILKKTKDMKGRILNQETKGRLPFPIVGRVKCGEKNERGIPRSLDYFIPSGDYAPLFHQAYGEKPSTIQIVFPSDDAELVCREEYVLRDGQGKLVATGDGETFKTWSEKAKKYIIVTTTEQPDIMAMLEKHYKQEWKITLTLVFILPLVRGVMGCWQFQTKGSASTIPQIRDTFDTMIEQNGKAAGVIFDLSVKLHKSNKPSDTSRYPVVTLVPNESLENLQKVHEARKPIALIESPENAKK